MNGNKVVLKSIRFSHSDSDTSLLHKLKIYYIFFIEELIKAGKLRVKWFCKDNILGG